MNLCLLPLQSDVFTYGFKGMATRQLSSLASVSTMATQSIFTTHSTIIGWNGEKFANEKSETAVMVRELPCFRWAIEMQVFLFFCFFCRVLHLRTNG